MAPTRWRSDSIGVASVTAEWIRDEPGATRSPRGAARNGRDYRYCAVGFLDALGVRAMSRDEALMNAIAFVAAIQQELTGSAAVHAEAELRTAWFSDNLGASTELSGDRRADRSRVQRLLRLLTAVHCHLLLEFGVLSRGGVALGQCYHDENVILGPALVAAVHLEWAADTPRIVISPAVRRLLGGSVPLFAPEALRTASRTGWPTTAPSIDFLRWEVQEATSQPDMTGLLEKLAQGAAAADAEVRYKWEWLRAKVAEFLFDMGPAPPLDPHRA